VAERRKQLIFGKNRPVQVRFMWHAALIAAPSGI
jgi:hypothetical protein